jgi:hypothetical protein
MEMDPGGGLEWFERCAMSEVGQGDCRRARLAQLSRQLSLQGTRVSVRDSLAVSQWSVRACQCGFCRAHGAFGIVNTLAMLPLTGELTPATPVGYGSESASARTERRELRWTPLDKVL